MDTYSCPIGIWIREVPLGFEMGLIQGNRLGITTLIWEETAHRDGSILSFWACTIQTALVAVVGVKERRFFHFAH